MERDVRSLWRGVRQTGGKDAPLLFSMGEAPQELSLCQGLYLPSPLSGEEDALFFSLREQLEEMEGRPVSFFLEDAHAPSEEILRALCRASVWGPLRLSFPCYTPQALPTLRRRLLNVSHTLRREGYDSDGGIPLFLAVVDALGALTAETILPLCDGLWLAPSCISDSLRAKYAPESAFGEVADSLCERLSRNASTTGLPVGLVWEQKKAPSVSFPYSLLARPPKHLCEESSEGSDGCG